MGSSTALVSAAGWRILFAAILAGLLVRLLTTTPYFATALVLAAAIGLLLLDLARLVGRQRSDASPADAAEARERAKQYEQALGLLDAVTVALFVLAPDGRISFVNRAARLLSGGAAGNLEDVACFRGEAAATILALPIGGRQLLTLADGRAMLVWVGAFSTPDGGPQRLVSAQAVAGELDAIQIGAWHSMTRVLAHEMMNSLTPIVSLSESLIGRERSGAGIDTAALETIGRQSRHLLSFVERYRAIADLPAPKRTPLDPALFLADIDALAGRDLRARGIAFSAALNASRVTAQADAALLRQAVLNLVRNAADAVAGTAEARIGLACVGEGDEVRFEVSDNGPGIGPDRLEEIFVPFFTTKENGAGIGLTLARQIALAHGGQVNARRNAASGMTFVLTIGGQA
ncbi:MAG TPA: ATP-binding protein [Allosphingosinicella sp.]|nr:ATP-binding protein [Allosphingosinicella sp.]